jgi:uncharacterized peroxidase-related enzyme
MSFIEVIPYKKADKTLKRVYNKVKGKNGEIDNILKIHSLRPHTLTGHMALYKNVLHNSNNTLPKWYLECIGVYVSILNECDYCVNHHFEGMRRLLDEDVKAYAIKNSLEADLNSEFLNSKEISGLIYSRLLTSNPSKVDANLINQLRKDGFTDGEILEINQVTGYFNYANRTVLGLGVNIEGDILGLSPNDSNDENNWSHQ